MKLYKKSELQFTDGYLTAANGNVVSIDNEIVDLFNDLEEHLQMAVFINSEPEPCNGPDMSKFERASSYPKAHVNFETPLLDAKIAEAESFMDELDGSNKVDKVNDALNGMKPLIDFVLSDNVLDCEHGSLHRFDTPYLGNPLEVDVQTVVSAVCIICGFDAEKYDLGMIESDEETDEQE